MINRAWIFIGLLCLISFTAHAVTRTVALDGSQQYISIQSAINASSNGDTVLVYPGTYYENVNFLNRRIELFSLEATTGDSTYISTTIINGGRTAPCVIMENGLQNAHLRGFTLNNGVGAPMFVREIISGGGILIREDCAVAVTNCDIWGNYAGMGAGMFIHKSSATFSGLKIHHNFASASGGGIAISGLRYYTPSPGIIFDPQNRCSVYENFGSNPTDIRVTDLCQNLQINLDMVSVENPSEFYISRHNNYQDNSDFHDTIDYQRAYRTEIDQDLYVSPEGNDENSGLSPSKALRSITVALHRIKANDNNRNTVRILPGTYTDTDQIFPIPLKSSVNVIGAGQDAVVIQYQNHETPNPMVVSSFKQHNLMLSGLTIRGDLESPIPVCPLMINYLSDSVIKDVVVEDFFLLFYGVTYADTFNCTLQGFTLRNCITEMLAFSCSHYIHSGIMKDCVFENIESIYTGGDPWGEPSIFGIQAREWFRMENCIIRDIQAQNQQSIFYVVPTAASMDMANVEVINCIFENLHSNWHDGTIFLQNRDIDHLTVSNCTFVNNYGPKTAITTSGNVSYRNNIVYNPDAPNDFYVYPTFQAGFSSNLNYDYNLIYGGQARIYDPHPSLGSIIIYGANNIDADPLFESMNINDPMFLRLSAASPCINAGTPDTTGLYLPPYDMVGNWRIWDGRIDMGCFEYGSEPWVSVDDPSIPATPSVNLEAFPNPFKVFTNIKVKLDKADDASVTIYNVKGQKVKTIALDAGKTGEQFTYWDGRDTDNRLCSSGIYLINLVVNGRKVGSKKVTMVR